MTAAHASTVTLTRSNVVELPMWEIEHTGGIFGRHTEFRPCEVGARAIVAVDAVAR